MPEGEQQQGIRIGRHRNLTGVNYRLPADTDVNGLLAVLQETLRDGGSLTVTVEMSDDPLNRAFVVINGSTVRHLLVGETPEPD